MHDPAKDIALLLHDAGVCTFGVDLFTGPVRPAGEGTPVQCVFVRSTGGLPADRFFVQMDEVRYPTVQVRVCSPSYQDGMDLARAVYAAAQSARPTGYMDVVSNQSEPFYMDQDENRHHHWSLNFELMYQE